MIELEVPNDGAHIPGFTEPSRNGVRMTAPKKIIRLGLLAAAISGSAMLAVPAVASAATAQPVVHSAAAHPNDCGGPCYPS
jgi:hypothetical protein